MMKQFVATAYILDKERVLLIFHKKLQKWLPPGGHVEPNELPHETAIREAKEETGIDIELISQENILIDRWNAKSIPRPYLCLLEEIPAHGNQPQHQHIDMIFVARPIGGKLLQNAHESDGLHWFSYQEMMELKGDEMIFEETKETITHLFKVFPPTPKSR